MHTYHHVRYNIGNETEGSGEDLTLEQKIKASCELVGISVTELANRLGTSQQNLSKRMKVGKFTQEELEEIAEKLGCEYVSSFVFPNGTTIK